MMTMMMMMMIVMMMNVHASNAMAKGCNVHTHYVPFLDVLRIKVW